MKEEHIELEEVSDKELGDLALLAGCTCKLEESQTAQVSDDTAYTHFSHFHRIQFV